jgi:hypothetical protein
LAHVQTWKFHPDPVPCPNPIPTHDGSGSDDVRLKAPQATAG